MRLSVASEKVKSAQHKIGDCTTGRGNPHVRICEGETQQWMNYMTISPWQLSHIP